MSFQAKAMYHVDSSRGGLADANTMTHWAALRALTVVMFLCYIAPLWLWLALPEGGELRTSAALALVLIEYTAFRLSWLTFRGQPRFLAIIFFVFVYVWGGLSAFAQDYVWIFPWGIRHDPEQAVLAVLQIILAVVGYEVGQVAAHARRSTTNMHRLEIHVSLRAVLVITLLAVPLTLIGIAILGPNILFATRGSIETAGYVQAGSKAEGLIGNALLRGPAFVSFLLCTVLCAQQWRSLGRAGKRALFGVLLLSCALNLIVNFPGSLTRQWLGTIVLAPVFALIPWRRWMAGGLAVGLVSMIIFIFPYSDVFRRARTFDTSLVESALQVSPVDNILHKGDFDVYQQTVNCIVVVERSGISWGKNIVTAALFWMPRSIWPDKAKGTGVIVAKKVGYPWNQTNLSSPLWMESFWAFGWPGVFIFMGIFGYVCGRLDTSFVSTPASMGVTPLIRLFVPFLAAFQLIALRGDLLNAVANSFLVIFLLWSAARMRVVRHDAGSQQREAAPRDRTIGYEIKGTHAS